LLEVRRRYRIADVSTRPANDARWGSDFGDSQHVSTKRRPFISVYEGAAAAMLGTYLCAYSRDQREEREWKSKRSHGWRPIYRINVRFK
jgi:hypothetical protein